jgi:hypothetical protein
MSCKIIVIEKFPLYCPDLHPVYRLTIAYPVLQTFFHLIMKHIFGFYLLQIFKQWIIIYHFMSIAPFRLFFFLLFVVWAQFYRCFTNDNLQI